MQPDHIMSIYCDESRHCNKDDDYLVIGAIKCPDSMKRALVYELNQLKRNYGIGKEFGWKTVSPNKHEFYEQVVEWFFSKEMLQFRCIAANKKSLWSAKDEDGFYVAYHQLLFHWFKPDYGYKVFLDRKKNSDNRQIGHLVYKTKRDIPQDSTLFCMEEVESDECVLIQLADLLIGAVGYAMNRHDNQLEHPHASSAKQAICRLIASKVGHESLRFSTFASERKFNVFWFGEVR